MLLDPVEIGEVIYNLVENAAKYAPPDTEITLQVKRDGGVLSVSVSDRGPGIPNTALPYLFDPFYRVIDGRPLPKGLGLGLAIVKGLVEAHGGRVWAENRAGGGARFTFTLPLERVDSVAQRRVSHPTGARVLVVDDEPGIVRAVQTNLGRHDFRVDAASDRPGSAGRLRATASRPGGARPGPAGHGWSGRDSRHPQAREHADHRALGARDGARQGDGARPRRGRLSDQAVWGERAAGQGARRTAPRRASSLWRRAGHPLRRPRGRSRATPGHIGRRRSAPDAHRVGSDQAVRRRTRTR